MNVSSIVVKTAPEHLTEVVGNINALDLCEVFFHDDQGRIIVTIEGETIGEEIKRLRLIQELPHVMSADLMYAYSERELGRATEELKKMRDPVPAALKESGSEE